MEKGEKFLPIGTVVMLTGGTKRAMITGFCAVGDGNEKIYDYSGCIYPEGFLSSNQVCLFDHEQIAQVYFIGLIDEEEKTFKQKLNEILPTLTAEGTMPNPEAAPTAPAAAPATPAPAAPVEIPSIISEPVAAPTETQNPQ